jgi:hypothetical protein
MRYYKDKFLSRLMKILLCTFLILFSHPEKLFSEQERGFTIEEEITPLNIEVGTQYAVFIGIDKYQHWLPLQNPVKDAQELKEILQSHYYIDKIYELYNDKATKANIIKLLDYLTNSLTTKDSLLIFFAGHGYFDKTTQLGYWIPVDGGNDPIEQSNWITNNLVTQYIAGMQTGHVLLIADSCFSGTLIEQNRGFSIEIDNEYFKKAYARTARQVITSGELEVVPDSSEFAHQLKMALLKNNHPYIDTIMIYNEIRLGVTKSMPRFGNLKETGHQEGASFLLFKRDVTKSGGQEISEKTNTHPWEESAQQTSGAIASHFSFGVAAGLTIPMAPINTYLKGGFKIIINADYNWVYQWGRLGAGLSTGFQSEECSIGGSMFDDFFPGITIPSSAQFTSIPFALHVQCFYNFLDSFYIFGEFSGGGSVSTVSSSTVFSLYFLPAAGLGYYVSEQIGISLYLGYNSIFLEDTPYNGIVIGVKSEIKL